MTVKEIIIQDCEIELKSIRESTLFLHKRLLRQDLTVNTFNDLFESLNNRREIVQKRLQNLIDK